MDILSTVPWLQNFNPQAFIPWASGQTGAGASFVLSRWVFLRAMGVIYLIAFVSLWVQIKGLIGSQGILPAESYLDAVRAHKPDAGRFTIWPTLFWLNASDVALVAACVVGTLCSILVIIGVAPAISLLILWLLYLSLCVAGQDFLAFQWDTLLLETGLLAILFAPAGLLPGLSHESAVSLLALFLLWWLLFRLMFESGIVKLTSGDPTWRNFTALHFHYFSQPLPSPASWYVHHLPQWFHWLSTLLMYAFELLFPFFIFFSRPLRLLSATGMIFLMVIIGVTGNYNFFGLLTVALCLLLVDDRIWSAVLPDSFLQWLGYPVAQSAPIPQVFTVVIIVLGAFILCVSSVQLLRTVMPQSTLLMRADRSLSFVDGLRSINSYGLFRVMTTSRPEIIIEGSNDGQTWQAYEFKYKVGDPQRAPPFIQPHQPRLDWQMWFAALGNFERSQWIQNLLVRLLQGKADVLKLFAHNPFPDAPPAYIRALRYNYTFTSPAERKASGAWWKRELIGEYSPTLSVQ